ncbi:hypothetical protein BO94DRAFT_280619 [Aspergillus sclerotioniger CBS 115572]|uniref:GXWXG domain-containing protein n=1 Tax=Aspergillus sclerotioniger CBS 115572 TaxID=1450535 RepID=A0A317X7Q2_9EURO|nr:hypothetical protein BO94DRAFT_280619 [Aspergillus sclerotioniger CBS 115572]PWY94646.1 hypothetical protein BO94DRAFT_280619 [Aspergillus sclerotioniger CBS 115572]
MTRTPADEYVLLTNKDARLDPSEVDDIYSQLQPADPASLEGEWDMHVIDTGHPAQALAEDILPLMNTMDPDAGTGKIHEMKFHGAAGSLLVPEDQGMKQRFRYVDESTIAATNDYRPHYGDSGVLHFYLTRAED